MKTQVINIGKLKPNEENPRYIKEDKFNKLVKSIKEFPQMLDLRPIVVNSDYVILGGNMRYKACVEAGLKKVPVIVADNLTAMQENEFIIKDNVSGGDWDWDVLANEWDTAQLSDWGLDVFTGADVELDNFFEDNVKQEPENKFTITLEYTEEEYNEVVELFKQYNESRESVVYNLLKK